MQYSVRQNKIRIKCKKFYNYYYFLHYIVTTYGKQWLDLTTSATLSILVLKRSKYGIYFILPSAKFTQSQIVLKNALKTSPNIDINYMWAATSNGSNIQYDKYKNTKQVVTTIKNDHEDVSTEN